MTNQMRLGDQIREARTSAGLTLRELAERAGVSRMTVYNLEQGHDTKISTAERVLSRLNLYMRVGAEHSRKRVG